MEKAARIKRATFISRSIELREAFFFARPTEILSAVSLYCCDFYGSMLWDFQGEAATMFFNTWRTCVKLTFNVPRQTKTFIVNHLLAVNMCSAREEILARFAGFVSKLASSPCREVRVLAALVSHDARTVTGRNVALIEKESGLGVAGTAVWQIRSSLVAARPTIPSVDVWRLPFLEKLLEDRRHPYGGGGEAKAWRKRREELIESLCV